MALAAVDALTYSYPEASAPALRDVSLAIEPGERIAVLGPSGGGKSTLLRALAGLVPHFHGGRFAGRVDVAGRDTRRVRPAELAGAVASVFQDPEDQVVMTRVANEVAFGLENVAADPGSIWSRVHEALGGVGAVHLAERRTAELSGGELQRICLASALALQPDLLLLDEPTSQLDPEGADEFLGLVGELDAAVVLAEQRPERALELAERVLFVEGGRIALDAPVDEAIAWLERHRPRYAPSFRESEVRAAASPDPVLALREVGFSYEPGLPVLAGVELEIKRGEIVVLEGPNGSGKTTLAKVAAGLLEPEEGGVVRQGRVGYVSQHPGRYVVCETALEEAALAVDGDGRRASAALQTVGLAWAAERHPRDLSSGERERLGIAAVAVGEPDLLVLDEPTRGLDPDRKHELAWWLRDYARRGRAVLVVTHDRSFPAHRRVALGEGRKSVAV